MLPSFSPASDPICLTDCLSCSNFRTTRRHRGKSTPEFLTICPLWSLVSNISLPDLHFHNFLHNCGKSNPYSKNHVSFHWECLCFPDLWGREYKGGILWIGSEIVFWNEFFGLITFKGIIILMPVTRGDTGSPWYTVEKQLFKLSPATSVIKCL